MVMIRVVDRHLCSPESPGHYIARLRAARGWTQEELAWQSGVSRPAIARLETGATDPRASTLVALARALDVGPGDLWAGVAP